MAENNNANVLTGKPKVVGGIWTAPLGTELPTDATTELSEQFVNLGLISEDGVTESETRSTESIKEWGGSVVAKTQTEYETTYQFTAIETNEAVAKARFGASNVTAEGGKVTKIRHNSKELGHFVYVIEMLTGEDTVARVVIPDGQVTTTGDRSFKNSDAIGYAMTVTAYSAKAAQGDCAIEYHATIVEPGVQEGE